MVAAEVLTDSFGLSDALLLIPVLDRGLITSTDALCCVRDSLLYLSFGSRATFKPCSDASGQNVLCGASVKGLCLHAKMP